MKKLSITPIESLGLPQRTICIFFRHQIESVEAIGRLEPAAIYRLLPYCDATYTLARYRHWHSRVYPCPPPLSFSDDVHS